jgi:hypothetical protein
MRLPRPLKIFFDLLKSVGLYLLVVIGGTVAFLSLAPVFGYLPYSDRPGPGWYGRFPAISWAEFIDTVRYMLGWAKLFIWQASFFALIIFLLARGLELVRTPRFVVAIICAVVSVFLTGLLMLAAGWYISIGAAPFYFAILLSVVFGALLVPKRPVRSNGDA